MRFDFCRYGTGIILVCAVTVSFAYILRFGIDELIIYVEKKFLWKKVTIIFNDDIQKSE